MTVEVLARKSAMSVANCSQHLQHLKSAGLVRVQPKGTSRVYDLVDDGVLELVRLLNALAARYYAELRVIYQAFMKEDHAGLEAVDPAALEERVTSGTAVLLDVRPPEEYAAGHLPGAISMPFEELARRLSELPRDRTIVAYCRGPFCVLSLHAVEALQEHGFRAVRLKEGITDWRGRRRLVND